MLRGLGSSDSGALTTWSRWITAMRHRVQRIVPPKVEAWRNNRGLYNLTVPALLPAMKRKKRRDNGNPKYVLVSTLRYYLAEFSFLAV